MGNMASSGLPCAPASTDFLETVCRVCRKVCLVRGSKPHALTLAATAKISRASVGASLQRAYRS